MRIGWGDESGSDSTRDPDTYILAAVVTAEREVQRVRDTMQHLLLKGQRKLHWRDEQDKRRLLISQTVASLPVTAVIVVRSSSPGEAMERRRRKCMERVLRELSGCDQLILESRGRADDRRDRAHLDALRRSHAAPRGLHTEHVAGSQDPGLWLADAVCGAVVRDRVGDPRHLEIIRSAVRTEVIETG